MSPLPTDEDMPKSAGPKNHGLALPIRRQPSKPVASPKVVICIPPLEKEAEVWYPNYKAPLMLTPRFWVSMCSLGAMHLLRS